MLGNQILQRTSHCSYVLSSLSSSGNFYKRWETAGEVVDHSVKCLMSKPKELSLDPQHVKGQAWLHESVTLAVRGRKRETTGLLPVDLPVASRFHEKTHFRQ